MNSTALQRLKAWFVANQRSMPWRDDPSPYAVWVSEIMLQQTRVSVVVPYFLRWMELFPTIAALAAAPIEAVLKAWEGLGYYSRARNLHGGARYVVEHFGGELPADKESLMQIKGLGSYTVGAILSFAFHKRAAAVDGNVLRVLARYYCIEKDIAKGEVQKEIRQHAEELLPENQSWVVSEALIELGATVCGKKPRCGECPLKSSCKAYLKGVAEELPLKSKSAKSLQLFRGVAVVECSGHLLLRQGKAGRVMADLYEFPYVELKEQEFSEKACVGILEGHWGLSVARVGPMEKVVHTFTKYKCTLLPHHVVVEHMHPVDGCRWITRDAISKLPFSSGHKRLLLAMQ